MKKMNKKGFTIVELVIVIAVIAILAAVMIPTFSSVVKNAQDSADLQKVKAAYSVYIADELLANRTPGEKLYVAVSTTSYVLIEKGNAKIVPNTTSVTGYTQMELYENATGEQSLKTKTN